MSGTKLEIEMKNDGKTSSCILKPGSEIRYSNAKEFVFDNVKITTDPQRYDQQEGILKI